MFESRRLEFLRRMGDAVAIIATHAPRRRNGDVDFRYRPASSFHYLTGFSEPEAVLVLRPERDHEQVVWFVPPKNPEREIWTGRRAGLHGVLSRFGADAAYPIEELDERLPQLLQNHATLYHGFGHDEQLDRRVLAALQKTRGRTRDGIFAPAVIIDPGVILNELRLFKSAGEIDLLRRAAAITARAYAQAMSAARPGMMEFEIEALVDFTFRTNGAIGPGYPTIVAGGENATILHYTHNDAVLRDGDLLLIDAGAEVEMYTADVTRTFPVSGSFTPPQRDLYEVVLQAQQAGIELARPGSTIEAIHEAAVRQLTSGLLRLGLLRGAIDDLVRARAYRRFYMHRTSHWLGMDVHDVGDYGASGKPRELGPGMVLTIEPGLYVERHAAGVDPRYHGVGIRIEDDLLITPAGHEVLTAAVPRSVAEVESACRKAAIRLAGG
ncbi:MAG: aminopeptidase P N-terminal domain-containing protein [Planctomycetota bacterium]